MVDSIAKRNRGIEAYCKILSKGIEECLYWR